ncbi:MAG TPA: RsmE family RNA methyltransferase [Bacteriovoracaceae bacterium]|nr:RsmE family RNA methyltransferase [Bacteriovoracaceae bacterium]
MRAIYLKEVLLQETYHIDGKPHHHLATVVRLRQGEQLLLLDGKGRSVLTEVEKISKKNTQLRFVEDRTAVRSYVFDCAIGVPKRDALELCLKQATELGLRRVYLIRSEFSQNRVPDSERLENLLVAALEQSNAVFLPEIFECSWETVPWNEYRSVLMLDSQSEDQRSVGNRAGEAPGLLIIGPEGGFSESEITFLHSVDRLTVVKLPTPILRTPTALSVGAGILLHSLLD